MAVIEHNSSSTSLTLGESQSVIAPTSNPFSSASTGQGSAEKKTSWDPVEPAASSSEDVSTPDYPTGLRLWLILISLFCSVFLIALDMTIVATAVPAITDDFQGLQDVSWYGVAFFMTTGGFQSTWGKVYKYFPLKRSFITAILIFQAGSLLYAVAPISAAFITGRTIAGICASGFSSGSYTIVAFIADAKTRPKYTGFLSAVYGIASVLGP
ncbi:major facilitator superfamily domain-containing protein [Stachybotrys elegans]|uniref:Major facilitator superfamily domain-containing protein n=1 Tax=Stachybotrys elegans TaxID=80388 RepID=A0A8K0SFG4_9HYPO|nr:major facilitator superfamily domain-containing protein [Stachybotrys elegans]